MNTCIDQDGNVIRKGMSVVCQGRGWVVGYASHAILRLDRWMDSGTAQSMVVGRRRMCCVHIVGFQFPLVFTSGNTPYIEP